MTKKDEIVKKIKSKGYWEVNIHPEIYNKNRLEKTKLEEIIQKAIVSLRGWDYPHLYGREDECESGPYLITNGIEKYVDWKEMIEFWRMTQSANFIHLLALREDWMGDTEYRKIWSREKKLKDNKRLLGVLGALYTLTEIFEFTKRLSNQNIFDQSIIVNIKLHNIQGRALYEDSFRRMPFSPPHISGTGIWEWSKDYVAEEMTSKSHEFSLNTFKDLVGLFGWKNLPVDSLKNEQQKFLEGKL